MLRVLAICYALQHYTFCICALALYRASLRLGLRALSQYTSLSLKLFYLVKFFPVHLMSSGTDHSSMAAKAVAIHNQMYANDMNVNAKTHKP